MLIFFVDALFKFYNNNHPELSQLHIHKKIYTKILNCFTNRNNLLVVHPSLVRTLESKET